MADFLVTTLDDETDDNGTLSLREAAAAANAASGPDRIGFAVAGTIVLDGTQLADSSKNHRLRGACRESLLLDWSGRAAWRVSGASSTSMIGFAG